LQPCGPVSLPADIAMQQQPLSAVVVEVVEDRRRYAVLTLKRESRWNSGSAAVHHPRIKLLP
jgi:hypothetical protein